MSAGGTTKVIVLAFLANLGIAIAKFVGAIFTRSASLQAEAIHSLVDCSNQLLLLLGGKLSQKAPTEKHPLGHGREAFFWSFMVAILLFSAGGMFAIYEGLHKLNGPSEATAPLVSLSILVFSLLLEGFSFMSCLKEVRAQNQFGSLWRWFRQTTASELLVIFTEDLAAMVGLSLATVCVLLTWLTGNPAWDAIGSVLVGVVLVVVAVLLAIEVKSLLVGETPSTNYRGPLQDELARLLPGATVLKLIAVQTGAHETMLACKFHPGRATNIADVIDGINKLELALKARFPEIRWQFFEPDDRD